MARTVTHDLHVLSVSTDGTDLVIDLYGGPSNACGSVRFTFNDPANLPARLELVQAWAAEDRALALLTGDDQIVLIDERRLAASEEAV